MKGEKTMSLQIFLRQMNISREITFSWKCEIMWRVCKKIKKFWWNEDDFDKNEFTEILEKCELWSRN